MLSKYEGIFGGSSGGANVWAAINLAKEITMKEKINKPVNIVTVIPDSGFK